MAKSTTPIKGLYLVGEDITSMGVSAAIGNGFLTALRVEKYFWWIINKIQFIFIFKKLHKLYIFLVFCGFIFK